MNKKPNEKAHHATIEADETEVRNEIELRAFSLWLADGCGHGNDLKHWLQAEKEVTATKPNSAHP